jgi:outer membrane protein TolC
MHRLIRLGLFLALLAGALGARSEAADLASGPAPITEARATEARVTEARVTEARVTETQFLSVLDASHSALAAGREALGVAQAEITAASSLADPVVSVVRENPEGPIAQTDWVVSWQLPGKGRRSTIAARERDAEAAASLLSDDYLSVRLAMREVFARWALAAARRDRLAHLAERMEGLARREAQRAERGEASGLEARRLELAASSLRARVSVVAAEAELARGEVVGWWPSLPAVAEPVLPELAPAPQRLGDHPRVRAAEAEVAAAELALEVAKRRFPTPEVSLGWQRQESSGESQGGPLLGLSWALPVSRAKRAGTAAAEARLAGAEGRLEDLRRRIESSREGARRSLEELAQALDVATASLESHPALLEGAQAAFRLGEASLTDLLDTYRSVSEAELAALDLRDAALAAHRELERVEGPGFAVPSSSRPQEQEPSP